MEYIQCPHCLKKYGVNDKIRAASGKTIRCKGCEEPFEITIFSTPSTQPPAEESSETTEKEQSAPAEEHVEKKSADKVKKSAAGKINKKNLQLIITSALGVVLLIALVVAYQFLDNPLPIEASQTEASQTKSSQVESLQTKPVQTENLQTDAIPQREKSVTKKNQVEEGKIEEDKLEEKQPDDSVADQNIEPPVEEKAELLSEPAQDEKTTNPPEESAGPATPTALAGDKYHGPANPSDECKEAATNQWFTDYMITNGSMSGKEYIRLLDESSSQTEEVLKLCKDKYLASRITEAAKLGESPDWISDEIDARSTSRYDNEANKESEW